MPARIGRRSLFKLPLLLLLSMHLGGQTPAGEVPSVGSARSSNILIVVFDAFAARHASLYGYPRQTTPRLAQLAGRATLYHAHHSAGNFTVPGTASLLTGTYPWRHRAFHLAGEIMGSAVRRNLFRVLGERGYQSIGYSPNLWADLLLERFGADLDTHLDPGRFSVFDNRLGEVMFPRDAAIAYRALDSFALDRLSTPGSPLLSFLHALREETNVARLQDEYRELFPKGLPDHGRWLWTILEDAIGGIQQVVNASARPFLAYFHLLPPHSPYLARREFVGLFRDDWEPAGKAPHHFSEGHSQDELDRLRREFDEYVAYCDAEFGHLYDSMAKSGILENTYLILTSDHGEMFERGIWQHNTPTLFEPIIRVPLLIWRPGQTQRQDVYTPTSSVDLLPTLCHATGQPIPGWCEGEILPGFASEPVDPTRSIYAVEAKQNPQRAPLTKATVALIKGRYKLIHYRGYAGYEDEYELYNLASDPEEMEDLYTSRPGVAGELRSELLEKLRQVNEPYRR